MPDVDLEQQRLENIKKNMEVLALFGVTENVFVGGGASGGMLAGPPKPKKTSTKKRVLDEADFDMKTAENKDDDADASDGGSSDERPQKKKKKPSAKPVANRPSLPGARRSARNASKPTVDYTDAGLEAAASQRKITHYTVAASVVLDDDGEQPRHKLGQRTQNPKKFGHIPGIPVGKTWELRMHCSTDAVHAPVVAGISGNKDVGAWSIALSGGYEDDIDQGYGFTFTGAGGRDLKGTKQNPKNLRTAPQSKDQSFENSLNAALKKSSETGKPVRVIRGFKLKSKYAPAEGYRYDGLYTVKKAWMETGLNDGGFLVCKFALVREPGQPPIPERKDFDENAAPGAADEEDGGEEGQPEAEATTEGGTTEGELGTEPEDEE